MGSDRFESWITGVRIDRLASLIAQVPSRHVNGMPGLQAGRLLFPSIGGSLDEVNACIRFLRHLCLVDVTGDRLARTREGDALAKRVKKNGTDEFAVHLLRSGVLANSIRTALTFGTVRGDSMVFELSTLKRAAPQLLAVLTRLSSVTVASAVQLPLVLAAELETAWNQMQLPGPAPLRGIDINLQVGERAELYSLQLEQSAYIGASSNIDWISRDDPSAGFDIEVKTPGSSSRMIEVKGSRGVKVAFILSVNELRKARQFGDQYEIHYWGDVRLHLPAPIDYERLRGLGYPEVIADPHSTLFTDAWICEAHEYRVRRSDEL